MKWRKKKKKSLIRIWLFVTPWTVAHQAPLSMGFSRQEYWTGLPFPSPGNRNKIHNKYNMFESSENHPPQPRSVEKLSSTKPVPVAKTGWWQLVQVSDLLNEWLKRLVILKQLHNGLTPPWLGLILFFFFSIKKTLREEGGGFRMGNTCIPVADSFWNMAKPIQYCKVKIKLKK